MIAEELLHFVWQFRLFNQLELYTTDNEHVKIQFVGEYNKDAGPDFLQACVTIAGRSWHGNIELHIDGNDWIAHGHHLNAAYNSVILHVVFKNPVPAYRQDGTTIPCLVVGTFLAEQLLDKYQKLMDGRHWIACEAQLSKVNEVFIQMAKGRMLAERMEQQYLRVKNLYKQTKADWEKILFVIFSRSFGMKVNAEVFMQLGETIDLSILRKYIEEPMKQEALFFGQGGFLSGDLCDDYAKELKEEYIYLNEIHRLQEPKLSGWKYLRMRPINFPPFRIAQLVGVYGRNPYLFANLLESTSLDDALNLLKFNRTASYWNNHYRFDKFTTTHHTKLSKIFIYHLLINAFIPVLFSYGKMMGQQPLQNRALDWLEELKAENNYIIRLFCERGLSVSSATDTQALLQLKKAYCDKKRCLECVIGLSILKS